MSLPQTKECQVDVQINELNVALYSTSLTKIQKLSSALRQKGIFAAFYQDAPSLVSHINKNLTHLIVVDRDCLQQVHKLLNAHPRITDGETLVAIYSHDSSLSLPESIWDQAKYRPVSMIQGNASLVSQLSSALHWVNVIAETQIKKNDALTGFRQIKDRFEKHISETEKSNKGYQQLQNVSAIVRNLASESIRDQESYLIALAKMFERWDTVTNYAFYTMNSTNQKLVAFDFTSRKYKMLPLLRLGKTCEDGIENFAQEMAYQVAFDEMGVTTVALRIEGANKNPDIICFISFQSGEFSKINNQYHWNLFEVLLSNVYRKMILQDFDEHVETQFLPVWDFLNFLDEESSDGDEYKFINVDLCRMNHFISKNPSQKFYWKTFFSDFLISLSKSAGDGSKLSTFGTMGILLAIPSAEIEKRVHGIKEVVSKFEYWGYFADSKLVIPHYIYPEASLIPASSAYYIKKLEALSINVTPSLSSHETTIRT